MIGQVAAIATAYRDASVGRELVTKQELQIQLAEMKFDMLKWIISLALAQFSVLIGILLKIN